MPKNQFNLLKIQTHVLKVHMNCQGCRQRVGKLLRRIEGVYKIDIDAEQQKVTVTGNVDSTILTKKLAKLGKHAELWPSTYKRDEVQQPNLINNIDNQIQDSIYPSYTFQNQHMLPMLDGDQFNNRSLFEHYLDQESGRYSSIQYNPVATTAEHMARAHYGDEKESNHVISMSRKQFDRVLDDAHNIRDYRFGIFPDLYCTEL